MSDDHFTHRCELFDAADMRIGHFGDSDFEEWQIELLTSDGDGGSLYDGLVYHFATALMALRPMPDFYGEDHL